MCMCNGIYRDILMFATMWGGVPKISEILEPSKALKQALLGLSPLSPIPIRHKMEIFSMDFYKEAVCTFLCGSLKK